MVTYTGLDWAGLKDRKKSIGRYTFFFLSGEPLSHQPKQQPTIAFFSTGTKYIATTEAGKEAWWIARLLITLGYRLPGQPISLKANNRGTILLTAYPEFHRRTKYIKVRNYCIQEKIDSKEIAITYIFTKEMVADGLTKALDAKPFQLFYAIIGMS